MAKSKSNDLKPIGNENSYTPEFFEELCQKINLKDKSKKSYLWRHIILAAQRYMSCCSDYERQLATHQIEKELAKILSYLDKAQSSLGNIIMSGNYGENIVDNLYEVISKNYPSLHGLLREIKRGDGLIAITSPARSLVLLSSMEEGIKKTIENLPSKKTTLKSLALYHWVMILSAELEPIIGHKLEQSHYYKAGKKGEYISKKEISDSELLQFIISPLDPNVTISQLETVIKETRKERHDSPWDDYFPKW